MSGNTRFFVSMGILIFIVLVLISILTYFDRKLSEDTRGKLKRDIKK